MANIRLATVEDGAAIAAVYGPYCESTVISFEEKAPSAEEMGRRIAAIGATRPWIVLEDSACGPSEARSGRARASGGGYGTPTRLPRWGPRAPRASESAGGPSEARSGRARASGGGAPRASENDGAVIGYAYASPHHERAAYRWSVSTAIYVSRDHQRCGAGRALYTTLFALLRALGYRQATAGITLPNPASIGLHAAFGFAPVGVYRRIGYKMGGWHDVGWYQAEIQPASERPADPRSIRELVETPEWHSAVARGLQHYGLTKTKNEKRIAKSDKRKTNSE